jgi:hypothetical protein
VSTIEDMEPPSKHGHEAKQADIPKLQGNGEALYSNSEKQLVPTLLRKESSGMSRKSMSESSQPPVMSPTISTGVKLGSELGSGKLMSSPSGSVPASEDTTRASAPAVPEFKRTGTAEFDVNATIVRVGSKGLERFDSQGGIQRMAEDEALPGIVMVHNPIEASQVKFS